MSNIIHKCSFCGKFYTEEQCAQENINVIVSPFDRESKICSVCLDKCTSLITKISKLEKEEIYEDNTSTKQDLPSPSQITEKLSEWIVGQDKAKKDISTGIYNHYKLLNSLKNKLDLGVKLEKSNMLLVGPTGTGKTAIIKALGEQLKVPYVITDANSLTQAGYVGRDVEDMLKDLLEAANGDLELAQSGIIYIDEIDKVGRKGAHPSGQRDISGEGVQQALLKLVEGGIFDIYMSDKRKRSSNDKPIKFDTTNVLFIGGGSFEGIETVIQSRLHKKSGTTAVGFAGKPTSKDTEKHFNKLILEVTPEDLKNFGMLPELLGRFPIVTALEQLSEEAMINILTTPKNALVKQYNALFKLDGIELDINQDALKEIAKKALEKKIGARALRATMEETLKDAMYMAPDINNLLAVKITKEAVNDPSCIKYLIAEESNVIEKSHAEI